ncbi:MAG TPA: hypothetical protein VEF34_19045 [Syntrophobacteraceae bacterium]|nr:hypothetical protein [Syntrophobacteraceae bacterium]
MKRILKSIVLMTAIVMAFHASVWAECRFDCGSEYARGVDTCRAVHPDPLDSGDLAVCIENSRDVYRKCVAGCLYLPSP